MTPRLTSQPSDAGRNEPLGPLPASVRALAKDRPFGFTSPRQPVWPLRCHDGRTWAQKARDEGRAA